jgi:hypothetical protein
MMLGLLSRLNLEKSVEHDCVVNLGVKDKESPDGNGLSP